MIDIDELIELLDRFRDITSEPPNGDIEDQVGEIDNQVNNLIIALKYR